MMKFFPKLILIATSSFLFHSCASSTDGSIDYSKGSSTATSSEAAIERQVLQLTNEYRASKGLKAVKAHGGLAKLSHEHSDFMSRNSGKFSVLGSTISHYGFGSRNKQAGQEYDVSNMGENVISTSHTSGIAAEMLRAWKASPKHDFVLRGKGYRYMGVGIKQANGRTHGTMLMAAPAVDTLPRFVGPQFR